MSPSPDFAATEARIGPGAPKSQATPTADPIAVSADTPLDDVALTLSERKIGSVIVNEKDGTLLGIFTVTDALNALIEITRASVRN